MPIKKPEKGIIWPHLPKEVRQKGLGDYTQPKWFMSVVVLAALFGTFAGIVGGMIINTRYFEGWLWGEGGAWKTEAQNLTRRVDNRNLTQDSLTEKTLASTVSFYLSSAKGTDDFLDPAQKIGSGFFLTADGLVATSKSFVSRYGKGEVVAVNSENKIMKVEKIILDPAGDLALVKVTPGNAKISTLPFNFLNDAVVGWDLWAPAPGQGLKPAEVLASNYWPAKTRADYYLSAENFYRWGVLNNSFAKTFLGSPLVNQKGELVGMITGPVNDKGEYSLFLSANIIETAYKSLKADSVRVPRAYLGLHYWEAGQTTDSDTAELGIVLANDPYRKLPAVESKSPFYGLLKAGDTLLRVAGENITALRTLPEILNDYQPGEKVEVVYRRDNEEKIVTVTLGELK
jgi:serine protease Do